MPDKESIDQTIRDIKAFATTISTNVATLSGSLPSVPATTITEYTVTMTLADTEYSQALPANTKQITISCSDGTAFRFAFATGKVATPTEPYQICQANQTLNFANLNLSSKTLYLGCGSAAKVVNIIAWT